MKKYTRDEFVPKRTIEVGQGNSVFRIRQIADTHQDADGFRSDLFETFVDTQAKDKNSVWIHTGDIVDTDRPSTRAMKKIMFSDREEAWTVDDKKCFRELDATIIPAYRKIASSCLGVLEGDHYQLFSNGMTSGQYLARALKVPYLGERSSFVNLIFRGGHAVLQYIIHARHGKGGVGTHGGDVAALVKQEASSLADLHLGAHSHKLNTHVERLEYITHHGIKANKLITYMRGGSFLEGFPPDGKRKTYAYRKEYNPLPCGWGEVELSIGREYQGGGRGRPFAVRTVKASIISG